MSLNNLIKPLSQLLQKGSCLATDNSLKAFLTGIAHPYASGNNWVVSQRLLSIRQQLNSDQELMAAILMADKSLRQAWCHIMAERCIEAGQLSDPQVLVALISQLDGAAQWVEVCLDSSDTQVSLQPSAYSNLERSLLGTTAEQSQAIPVLARVLAAASRLVLSYQQAGHQQLP